MFERAEKLGMTVEQLTHKMSHSELIEWYALDGIRADERKRAEQQAKKGMKRR